MRRITMTPWKRAGSWAALLVLCLALTGETCTVDKTIEVTVGAEVIARFEARGSINTFNDDYTVNVATDADIRQVLEDNGFEDEVVAYIEGAFVRVTKQDNNATPRTVTGTVTVEEGPGGGTPVDLLVNASAAVNDPALANWIPVPLQSAGVDLMNDALEEYLLDLYLGDPSPDEPVLTFHISGVSEPPQVETNFDWEVKVIMTLVGKKDVTVVDPL
jgi:hypothetical protein